MICRSSLWWKISVGAAVFGQSWNLVVSLSKCSDCFSSEFCNYTVAGSLGDPLDGLVHVPWLFMPWLFLRLVCWLTKKKLKKLMKHKLAVKSANASGVVDTISPYIMDIG